MEQGEGFVARHLGATIFRAAVRSSPKVITLTALGSSHCYSISTCLDVGFPAVNTVETDNASVFNTTAVVAP